MAGDTATTIKPSNTNTIKGRPRHIVARNKGVPEDQCLCGYIWDVYPIRYDPEAGVCAKCLEVLQKELKKHTGS